MPNYLIIFFLSKKTNDFLKISSCSQFDKINNFLSKVVLFSLWFWMSCVQIYYWELWTKKHCFVEDPCIKNYQIGCEIINQVCILIVSNPWNFGFLGLKTEKILRIKLISMSDGVTCRGTVEYLGFEYIRSIQFYTTWKVSNITWNFKPYKVIICTLKTLKFSRSNSNTVLIFRSPDIYTTLFRNLIPKRNHLKD